MGSSKPLKFQNIKDSAGPIHKGKRGFKVVADSVQESVNLTLN